MPTTTHAPRDGVPLTLDRELRVAVQGEHVRIALWERISDLQWAQTAVDFKFPTERWQVLRWSIDRAVMESALAGMDRDASQLR